MSAKKLNLSRLLPKTGQVTSYRDGDDGYYEVGWWRGRLNANNKERFIEKTISGDVIIIDRATGLVWPKDFENVGGFWGMSSYWTSRIDDCLSLSFAGFTDWRMPNINELTSLLNYSQFYPAIYDVFTNIGNKVLWSSTRYAPAGGNFWTCDVYNGVLGYTFSDDAKPCIAVRGGL